MSNVTVVSRPNRIVIASKGVQGAPGPDGPQGIQGPKGDTGDVTPEAIAARDAAQEAASTASTAASTATGAASAASGSASAAAASANLAEQARLLGATIGFATKADMDASLAHPEGTLALVTSDATASNNGTYRKTGASGSGSWVQSADRVTGLEGRVLAVEGDVATSGAMFPLPLRFNLDVAAGFLRVTASQVRVFHGRKSFLLAGQDVALPSGRWRVIANSSTGAVSFIATTNLALPANSVLLGFWDSGSAKLYGFPPHYVNGAPQPEPITSIPPVVEKFYSGVLVALTSPSAINFDWAAGLIRISGGAVRCLYGTNRTETLPAQDVPIPAGSSRYRLLLNTTTLALSTVVASSPNQPPVGSLDVGMMSVGTKEVFGVPFYHVNGASPGSTYEKPPLHTLEWIAVEGQTQPRFTLPALLPDYKAFADAANSDHNTIYARYDALLAAYPDYVSKSSLGMDGAGNTIYRYDFKPPTNFQDFEGRLAKMILVSGVHGFERGGIYCLYEALNQICTRWRDDELLETLRWNCHFIVIPAAVPWGFDNYARKNENGVDVARNFRTGWGSGFSDPSHAEYQGPSSLSEPSSQYIDAIMAANQDALYFGSFHNMATGAGSHRLIWNAAASTFGKRLSHSLFYALGRKWKAAYSWMPQDNTTLIGWTSGTPAAGSEGRTSTEHYGIQGGTFEVSRVVPFAPDSASHSSHAATLGTEAIVNWLLMNLEHGARLYNGRATS